MSHPKYLSLVTIPSEEDLQERGGPSHYGREEGRVLVCRCCDWGNHLVYGKTCISLWKYLQEIGMDVAVDEGFPLLHRMATEAYTDRYDPSCIATIEGREFVQYFAREWLKSENGPTPSELYKWEQQFPPIRNRLTINEVNGWEEVYAEEDERLKELAWMEWENGPQLHI